MQEAQSAKTPPIFAGASLRIGQSSGGNGGHQRAKARIGCGNGGDAFGRRGSAPRQGNGCGGKEVGFDQDGRSC